MKLNRRYTNAEVKEKFKETKNELIKLSLNSDSTKLLDPECTHYLKYYWDNFKHLRNKPIKILEIGVKDGDSLKIWKDFFTNKDTLICGAEINPVPLKNFKEERVKIFYGDQTDINFLKNIVDEVGEFDIIIDDGGHTQHQLKTSFEYLFRYGLKTNGQYVMEDLGCSYWYRWSGGLNNNNSIINYLKNKIDSINYRFWKGGRNDYINKPEYSVVDSTYWDENILSMTFVKGMCFIKKGDNSNDGE